MLARGPGAVHAASGYGSAMATDLFLRNPWHLRDKLPAYPRLAWTRQFLRECRINPDAYMQYHLVGRPFRVLTVDIDETTDTTESSTTTHPTWVYGDRQSRLESYLREQLPMVVIAGIPVFMPPFLEFFHWLSSLQEDYPDTKIHLHGGQEFTQIFGLNLGSADYDAVEDARGDKVRLPNGRRIHVSEFATWGKWFRMLGWNWREVTSPQLRTEFNMAAAAWASQFFKSDIPFTFRPTRASLQVKPDEVPTVGTFLDAYRRRNAEDGDKIICDVCSLAPHCKLYRAGAVCTLNESPSRELAELFGSRDSNKIIDGLNKLLKMQAERITEARDREATAEDGLDEKVTKLIDNMINQGVKVAKLINPALANPKMQVNIGLLTGEAKTAPPKQLATAAIAELERRGHARENITLPMVEDLIREMTGEALAIEASSEEV